MAVYFVESAIGNIKIGTADEPEKRLYQLKTASPIPLKLLGSVPGGVEVERDLHQKFARARLHGEWFAPIPELRTYLAKLGFEEKAPHKKERPHWLPHPSANEVTRHLEANFEGTSQGWHAQFYCENQQCDIREVEIRVKEFSYDPPHVRGPFFCPNCGEGLKFHWAKNLLEWSKDRERQSRINVNVQRYRRDNGGPDRPVGIPGTIFSDDSLPL